ncbi:GNAT family N-acetyltransferase [Desulforamulus aquiferis]|uniref:N-acetyltransferase n=1 Tax=Desulforamulus aquiferis TaxID=1397668 RepID=A0AAW7ZA79_9FIRM|nr:N-acetyltransferase [Desulforamulus aquiferis]MDO7786572.1 N-acetyltransferase [Desulforamulus aquiferis]
MNQAELKYREATPEDIKDIMFIEDNSFEQGIREEEDVFLERIITFPNGFLLLEYKNKVIGYICSEIWEYQENIDLLDLKLGHSIKTIHDPAGEELYISSMGVLPEFRRKGLGELMFESLSNKLLKTYPKIKSILLIVSKNWLSAQRIYRKNGFREVATIPNFFQPLNLEHQDGIVMRSRVR